MEHIAIQGTFADLKSVKTRSVVQMVVEIPIEQAEQVVKAFGFPQPGAEIAVAVARLDPEKARAAPTPPETPAKAKTRFHDKPLSVQAGIRCSDASFRRFLVDKFNYSRVPTDDEAAKVVREYCSVDSRKEFNTGGSAGRAWIGLNAEFEQWAGLATEQH